MITVVIANYNYSHLLAHCIESVLSQTLQPEGIVVVDDCSDDPQAFLDIVHMYKGISYIKRKENLGIVENFNDVLFNEVKTERVMFLGADNYLRPDALELMAAKDADIVSSNIALFGTEAKKFGKHLPTEYENGYDNWLFEERNIRDQNYIHGSSLYRTRKARIAGGYEANPDSERTEEDWMLWKKMLTEIGASHEHVEEPLLYYRRHKNNFYQV